jgi:hypothetical protein
VIGLNQYPDVGPNVGNNSQGAGPLRGTLSAGSDLFGSLTQSDRVSDTIFAETARRPMSVTPGPGTARQAFQVLRSGHLIMTYSNNGEIVSHQLDITQRTNGPAITGDPSAVTDANGIVHVFGRDSQDRLIEYQINPKAIQLDPNTVKETYLTLPAPPAGVGFIAANPTAFDYGTVKK